MLYVYCIEKDINVLNEKNSLLDTCCKHGVSWRGTLETPPKLTQILSDRPNYTSTFIFMIKKNQDRFLFFVVLIICNFFRTRKTMYKVQKVTEISSQLGSIQEFYNVVNSFHSITKCIEPDCPVGNLGSKLKK